MGWRIVVVSNTAKLDYKMGFMYVRLINGTEKIAIDEIQTVIVENPAVAITGCLLQELITRKIKVIFCDDTRSPIAELVAHHGSHDCSGKIRTQMNWPEDIMAIVWQEIVSEKIRKQAEFLKELGKNEEATLLMTYIGQVEEYDETNREGHAAKVYFNALFGKSFTRSADIAINHALNYGYSLILSLFNREIVACGYLTQLGIFHCNMFNPFNLACDLMEPYRILVDRYVLRMLPNEFQSEEKHTMLNLLNEFVYIDNSKQYVTSAARIYVHSVFDAINDGDPSKIKHFSIDDGGRR